MSDRHRTVLCFALLFFFAGSHCVAAGPSQNAAKSNCYRIPIWTLNGGKPAESALEQEKLQISVADERRPILGYQPPSAATLLFLAFDVVGDIAYINAAKQAIVEEVGKLGSQYWVGLLSAQAGLSVLQDPTADREVVRAKIQSLSQIGKAGLLESVQRLADFTSELLRRSDVRVALIIITDSDIGNYQADYLNPPVNASDNRDLSRRFAGRALQEKIARMSTAMARIAAPLFIVHIDPARDPLNRAYHSGLKQLTDAVGGQLFLAKTSGDIPRSIGEAFLWTRSFHVIDLSAPEEKSGFVKLSIRMSEGGSDRRSPNHLSYPPRLFLP